MNFKDLSDSELLNAYKGYQMLAKTGAVGEEDFGGIFRRAIDEREAEKRGYGLVNAANELLAVLAEKWFTEHAAAETVLTSGTELWRVDDETGEIERAVVVAAHYHEDELESFSVDFPDCGDFDEFFGSALGSSFFRSEAQAKLHLKKGI